VPDGDYGVTFRIYDVGEGGVALWAESKTVTVQKGIFNTALGDATPFGELPFDGHRWLGITVGEGEELLPRAFLTSSPYSLCARNVMEGSIVGSSLLDGTAVRSLNGLTEHVGLGAGANIDINQVGNDLIISAFRCGGRTFLFRQKQWAL
jgi:hypothetical protein